jgi:hypothetical protein
MAPIVAETAPVAQRQARRPLSRIVPAIPHRLSRSRNIPSTRPITPDESNKGTVPQCEPEPQPVVEEKPAKEQLPQTNVTGAPMTPDSRASTENKNESDTAVLAASPAKSAEDHVDLAVQHPGRLPAALLPCSTAILTGPFTDVNLTNGTSDNVVPSSVPDAEERPATNGVHRKLTVPAELPPPFYPSHKTDTRTPTANGSDMAVPLPHRSQLSAGAVAFSVGNGSPALPATPHELDQNEHVQPSALPRPPPGFSAPEHSASFFPEHSHHPSDVGGPWSYPPYSMAQTDALYENGIDHQPTSFSGPTAYLSHYNGSRPGDTMNGTVPSHAESPSKSQFGEVKSGSDRGDGQRVPYQNGATPHVSRFEEPPFELAAYLSSQFGNPEFADFILQIRSPDSVLVSLPVHGIIVVRSPVIAEAVRRSIPAAHRSRDARRMLDVPTADPFVTREALEEAVKVLYGAPLLSAQGFLYGLAPYVYDGIQTGPPNDARMRMRQLLSYMAAGRALQLPSMQARGVDIARSLLRWDTVEEVLQVALRSNSPFWPKTDGTEAEDPFTAALLSYAIDFMAYTFPVDFHLYTIAPELEEAPRLPLLLEARSATHNPRLSKIRFGDAPPEDDLQPNHASRVLSSILLSLPLPLVDRLFNHRATADQIGWTGVVRTMRDVIVERENRRQKALRSEVRSAQDGVIPGSLLGNMYTEERVEQVEESPLHPSGHRLVARRLTGHV